MSQKAVTDAVSGSSVGVGQKWYDVTGSRARDNEYTNNTGKLIFVSVICGSTSTFNIVVDGLVVSTMRSPNTSHTHTLTAQVPVGSKYSFTGGGFSRWLELR